MPLSPGVYIMRDKTNTVIYVGKAVKLRNRVSQYFQDTSSHSPKTRMMVSKVDDFDVIIAASEFEALVLECSLIKQHMPKYNILLKDDKGYPYLRLNKNDLYPKITMVSKTANDGADYYGPFGSRSITQNLIETIQHALKLPACSKEFPRDIGKDRVCLNYHMNQCEGWCQKKASSDDFRARIEQARQLLSGNFKQVSTQIKEQMLQAAEDLNFELAASLRDRLKAVEALGQKQFVTAGRNRNTDVVGFADTDAIGFYQNENKACFTVLHFSSGNLLDKDYEIIGTVDDPEAAVGSLLSQYYLSRGCVPKYILLPFALSDSELLEQLLEEKTSQRPKIKTPQRGDNLRLIELANVNAKEEVERVTTKEERTKGTLQLLT